MLDKPYRPWAMLHFYPSSGEYEIHLSRHVWDVGHFGFFPTYATNTSKINISFGLTLELNVEDEYDVSIRQLRTLFTY